MTDDDFARAYLGRFFGHEPDPGTLKLVSGLIAATPHLIAGPLAHARAQTAEGTLFDIAPCQHAGLMRGGDAGGEGAR